MSEKSGGEFKKRLDNQVTHSTDFILSLIDEAKQEFTWRNIVEDLIQGKEWSSEQDIKLVAKWFVKWFGTQKEVNRNET